MKPVSAARSPTIRDVAALASVSIKTVSRVLNSEAGVLPETQDLVQTAVAQLNYTPNPSARNLASVVDATIGLAYSHLRLDDDDRGGHQYSMILQIGALEACQQNGFGLIPMPCDARAADKIGQLVAWVKERRIGGLVIAAPLGNTPGLLDSLQQHGIPYACINPNDLAPRTPLVAIDEVAAAREMTEHLIAYGHRKIAFIKGMQGSRVTDERYRGYAMAHAAHGLDVTSRWVAQGEFTFRSGVDCGRALLSQPDPPTAIFASNDDMAVGVMHAAHAKNIRIPADLSVAGFDDTELARFSWPPLTTIRQPLEQMAHTAVEQLIGLVRPRRVSRIRHPAHVIYPCKLIPRASVAAPASRLA